MRRVALIALLILIVVILAGTALLWRAGELRTLAPHFAGRCTLLPMAANAKSPGSQTGLAPTAVGA